MQSKRYLISLQVEYFVAANGIAKSSCYQEDLINNHAAGETAIILGLCTMNMQQKRVTVYGNNANLFALLVMHCSTI